MPQLLKYLQVRFPSLESVGESFKKLIGPVVVTSLTMTSLTLGIRQVGLLQGAEFSAYDQFVRMQPDEEPDNRLLVVGITENDLQTLQEWPLSDLTLAKALRNLHAYSPKAIGIDLSRDIPIGPGRKELFSQLQAKKNTVVACKVSSEHDPGTAPPKGFEAGQVGFADLVIDPGGTLRRNLLMFSPPKPLGLARIKSNKHICSDPQQTLLSLGLNTALQYLQQKGIEASMTNNQQLKVGTVVLPPFESNMGGYRGADAGGYQLLLRYRSANNSVKQVSLIDLLNDRATGDLIRDRIVFIGYTTPFAQDDFYTPYSGGKGDQQKMPGVVVHAQAASQILSAVLDGRQLIWTWPFGIELAWIFGCSLLGGIVGWYVRHPIGFVVVALSISGLVYAFSLILFFQGGWIPLVPAIAAFIATAIGVVLFDRFNNSVYGQAVYTKVKTLLHLEVEIDEDKLEKQVAEITETDYFKELQSTVKDLRTNQAELHLTEEAIPIKDVMADVLRVPSNGKVVDSENSPYILPLQNTNSPNTSSSEPNSSTHYEVNYFSQLKHESQELKPSLISQTTQVNPLNHETIQQLDLDLGFDQSDITSASTDQDDDFDFLKRIKKEGQNLNGPKQID